jgi:hypothetical protein
MSLRRAKCIDEYIDGVRQAVFEVGDPQECLQFESEDLPFLGLASKCADEIPFHTLLTQINNTHRWGLDAEGGRH